MREPLQALAGMRQSCPENLFEIAIISLLLQNATVARTTQMMTNLLDHYHASKAELMTEFQAIKGVGSYTAAIIASHAVRDPSALGLDVWNRKLLAKRFLDTDDAEAKVVMATMQRLFPGYEGLAGLYVIENAYREQAVVELV